MDEMYIGHRLTQLRLQKNVSERQMSLDMGHSPSYINGLASGKMPSLPEFIYICEYLGTTPSDFFDEARQPSLIQQEAIDYIYKMDESDTELIISVIKRIRRSDEKRIPRKKEG